MFRLRLIVVEIMKFWNIFSDSQEIIFETQLIKFSKELNIPIKYQSSSEDLEFLSSYLTFIKFARIFCPEPGSCISAAVHRSGMSNKILFAKK